MPASEANIELTEPLEFEGIFVQVRDGDGQQWLLALPDIEDEGDWAKVFLAEQVQVISSRKVAADLSVLDGAVDEWATKMDERMRG